MISESICKQESMEISLSLNVMYEIHLDFKVTFHKAENVLIF